MMKKEMDAIDKDIVIIDEKKEKKTLEKYANYYFLLDFWLKNMEQGKKISSFFENRKYKSISIYCSATKWKIKFCVMAFANIFQWANFIHRFF